MNNNVFISMKGTVLFFLNFTDSTGFLQWFGRTQQQQQQQQQLVGICFFFFVVKKKQKTPWSFGFNKNPLVTIQSIPKPPGFNGSGMSSESDPLSTFGTKRRVQPGCYRLFLGAKFDQIRLLGGGFKYFLFSPLFGEDSHFD